MWVTNGFYSESSKVHNCLNLSPKITKTATLRTYAIDLQRWYFLLILFGVPKLIRQVVGKLLDQVSLSAPIFSRKVLNLLMIILLKALFNSSSALIAKSCKKLTQCQNKCFQWICGFNMNCPTCKASKYYPISPSWLLYTKWTKHIHSTECERGWIGKSLSWKFCHLLCGKLTSMTSADYVFVYDTSCGTVSTYYLETW